MTLGGDMQTRSELLRGVLGIAAAAGTFRAGAAVAVTGQPRLSALNGPHQFVGVKYCRVGGARAKLFYPAKAASEREAPYCTDGRDTSDGMAGLVGFKQLGLSFLLAHLATAPSGCWSDAPPIDAEAPLPLLCYSHGFGGNMDMSSYLMRQIASHGVVVAAIEHTDGTASNTVLEDGHWLSFSPRMLSREAQLRRRAEELLAAAVPGALGAGLPPIDPSLTFLGGHSYGGPSALLAESLAPPSSRIAGMLLHDPAIGMNAGIDAAAARGGAASSSPTLSFVSDEYDRFGVRCGTTFHTVGGFHGNFVDAPLWAPPWVMRPLSVAIPAAGPADPSELHGVLARTGAAFLRRQPLELAAALKSTRLLEFRGGALAAGPLPPPPDRADGPGQDEPADSRPPASSTAPASSPMAAMSEWRLARVRRFGHTFDASRYHAQVLFVDDDGARARTCEAVLERVAMWADAGWWIYPHAASTANNVADGDGALPSLLETGRSLGLCTTRLNAPAATIGASDLLDYDLICCVDLPTMEAVQALAREVDGRCVPAVADVPLVSDEAGSGGQAGSGGSSDVDEDTVEARVVCLTDFLAYRSERDAYSDRIAALDDEMRSLVAPHYSWAATLSELPSAAPSDKEAWSKLLAVTALSCASLTSFLKERIDDWFVEAFIELLQSTYPTAALLEGVGWQDAEDVLRRHIVTGGLTIEERRRLFLEHRDRVFAGETTL